MQSGQILGDKFDQFILGAGFRSHSKHLLAPLIDFLLVNGRFGLIAFWFAGFDVNRGVMQSLVSQKRFPDATKFVADPLAQHIAQGYIDRRVGIHSFPQAITMMKTLASDAVPVEPF